MSNDPGYIGLADLSDDTPISFQYADLTIDNSHRGHMSSPQAIATVGDLKARWESVQRDWQGHAIVWAVSYRLEGYLHAQSATFRVAKA